MQINGYFHAKVQKIVDESTKFHVFFVILQKKFYYRTDYEHSKDQG